MCADARSGDEDVPVAGALTGGSEVVTADVPDAGSSAAAPRATPIDSAYAVITAQAHSFHANQYLFGALCRTAPLLITTKNVAG